MDSVWFKVLSHCVTLATGLTAALVGVLMVFGLYHPDLYFVGGFILLLLGGLVLGQD